MVWVVEHLGGNTRKKRFLPSLMQMAFWLDVHVFCYFHCCNRKSNLNEGEEIRWTLLFSCMFWIIITLLDTKWWLSLLQQATLKKDALKLGWVHIVLAKNIITFFSFSGGKDLQHHSISCTSARYDIISFYLLVSLSSLEVKKELVFPP